MTLCELIDVYDDDREKTDQFIEICRPGQNWEDFDRVPTCSCLLIPFYSAKINCIGTENKNAIRVDIDWDELNSRTHIFEWMRRDNDERIYRQTDRDA